MQGGALPHHSLTTQHDILTGAWNAPYLVDDLYGNDGEVCGKALSLRMPCMVGQGPTLPGLC